MRCDSPLCKWQLWGWQRAAVPRATRCGAAMGKHSLGVSALRWGGGAKRGAGGPCKGLSAGVAAPHRAAQGSPIPVHSPCPLARGSSSWGHWGQSCGTRTDVLQEPQAWGALMTAGTWQQGLLPLCLTVPHASSQPTVPCPCSDIGQQMHRARRVGEGAAPGNVTAVTAPGILSLTSQPRHGDSSWHPRGQVAHGVWRVSVLCPTPLCPRDGSSLHHPPPTPPPGTHGHLWGSTRPQSRAV